MLFITSTWEGEYSRDYGWQNSDCEGGVTDER